MATSGGYKEIVIEVKGTDVYAQLKFESGAHRVQRVPKTESQGRIHTSAATVAVIPCLRIRRCGYPEIRPQDRHLPRQWRGWPARQQDGVRSAIYPPPYRDSRREYRGPVSDQEPGDRHAPPHPEDPGHPPSRARFGHGLATQSPSSAQAIRSDKIRTYNYPQNRVTDHRINLTLYNLDQIIEGQIQSISSRHCRPQRTPPNWPKHRQTVDQGIWSFIDSFPYFCRQKFCSHDHPSPGSSRKDPLIAKAWRMMTCSVSTGT